MTASLLPNGKQQFLSGNGVPLAAGSVYFYVPTTSTLKTTWQNPTQTILNTNPVILDASGEAVIYGDGSYRQVVYDALGNLIWDQLTSSAGAAAASSDSIGLGFTNFVVPPLVAPVLPNGLSVTLPAGNAVLNNQEVPIPETAVSAADNSIIDYYLNPLDSLTPWTIEITPLSNYTAAIRHPSLLKVWTIQTLNGAISAITMLGRIRPVYPYSTDVARVVDQVAELYQVTSNVTAWSSGAAVSYGEVISTTDGNLYQVFTLAGGVLGVSKPTGTSTVLQTNGTVQVGYYGQTSYENNLRYSLNGGIQSYFTNVMAALIVDLQGTNGTQMSTVVKAYLVNQFKHLVSPRQNSTAYTYGQKITAGNYVWVSTTVAGGSTAGGSPFSGTYTPNVSTVVDGTVTWLCIYASYASQAWYWMRTDASMTIYTPADAHDSDAATFLAALWAYIQVTWDWQWLSGTSQIAGYTYLQCLQNIYDFNLGTAVNALTETFQQNISPYDGSSFTQQYTEDNCECYTGYLAAAGIFNLLGDSTRNGEAVYGASLINSGLFGLIDAAKNVIGWYYGDNLSWYQNPTLSWYPRYQAQLFIELHQVPAGNDTFKQGVRQYVMQYWNNWPQDPGLTAGIPNIMFAYVAAKYWQDTSKVQAMLDITETSYLKNGLLASDFGYYLQTKNLMVNSQQIANINGIKVTYNDPAGNSYTTNQTRIFTAAGACNTFYGDYWVGINKGTGAATVVNLPIRTTIPDSYTIIIVDVKGDANSNNITLTPDGGNINGSGTLVISAAYGKAKVRYNLVQNQWYAE